MIFAEVMPDGFINQVWDGVEDSSFNPRLLPGAKLVTFPDGTGVRPGLIWDGSRLVTQKSQALDLLKETAKRRVVSYIERIEDELTEGYSRGEVASWPAKLSAAYNYVSGTATQAERTMIETEAAEKGITSAALCNLHIIPNGEWYAEAVALISALRAKTFAAIDAAMTADEVDMALQNALTAANQKWVDLIARKP